MSCAPCKAAYSGGNPGADGNTYVLFSSAEFPKRHFAMLGYTRINASILGDNGEGGTLQLQKSNDGVVWQTVHDDTVAFTTGEAQVYDYQVGLYDHFRLQFVNDGNAKTIFEVDVALMPEHTPTQ